MTATSGLTPLPIMGFHIKTFSVARHDTIIWDKTIELDDRKLNSQKYLYQPFSFYYKPNWVIEYIFIFKKTDELPRSDYIKDPFFDESEFIKNYSKNIWKIEPIPPDLQDIHPARFPFEIPYNLIKFYSNKGDVVFDCFGGFGTTLIEALRLDRIAVGNDKIKKYCELMERNIKLFQKNPNHFYDRVKLYRMKMNIRYLKEKEISKSKIIEFLYSREYSKQLITRAINSFF